VYIYIYRERERGMHVFWVGLTVSVCSSLESRSHPSLDLYRIFVHFNAFVNEPISILLPPPPAMLTLLH